jgi:hypothetical protein
VRPNDWLANTDFTGAAAMAAQVVSEFDGWALELTAPPPHSGYGS